jgi:hypothetical protein
MFGLSKPVLYAGIALALSAIVTMGVAWGVSSYRGIIEDARQAAYAERDKHWESEIAKHNTRVTEARLAAAEAAARADAVARAAEAREAQLQSELEARNVALPNSDSPGLSRDRVCLISPASCAK